MTITLYSYPELYGLAENNPYGLKVFAFLRLCNLAFRHEHIFDAKTAPRGQLPYIEDDGEVVGDSDAIDPEAWTTLAIPHAPSTSRRGAALP